MTQLRNAICRKISAKTLEVKQAPATLPRHNRQTPPDKILWDAAYAEEYYGLKDLGTWEVISDEEYQKLKPIVVNALPSMAISTIKRDQDGKPIRCKYRLVVLGNLDPNNLSKSDCFAPVLSQLELRLLLTIAVSKNCTPKTADVSQAFVQSLLPSTKPYVIKPPTGCPLSKPNTYLRLLKTLYGLKRSPRHWYEKARSILISLCLHPCPHAPCLFKGSIIPGQPPLFLGLYVDDMVYFSESIAVEQAFENKFGSKIKTTFNGPAHHFLGLTIDIVKSQSNNISIHLSQQAFIESLLDEYNYNKQSINSTPSTYKSGIPIDSIPLTTYPPHQQTAPTNEYQHLVGSFQWLAILTRPDIATVTKYLSKPTIGHLNHCKHVLRYLKGTIDKGITFSTQHSTTLISFVHFPINDSTLTGLSDANWAPQDQSIKKHSYNVPLFHSRSMSGYIQWLIGPLHWTSKRQTITARSTAEAEIYATYECTKNILHIRHILEYLHLLSTFCPMSKSKKMWFENPYKTNQSPSNTSQDQSASQICSRKKTKIPLTSSPFATSSCQIVLLELHSHPFTIRNKGGVAHPPNGKSYVCSTTWNRRMYVITLSKKLHKAHNFHKL